MARPELVFGVGDKMAASETGTGIFWPLGLVLDRFCLSVTLEATSVMVRELASDLSPARRSK